MSAPLCDLTCGLASLLSSLVNLSFVGSGAAPVGVDSQRPLYTVSNIWLGDVCGRHTVDPHNCPLLRDPFSHPATTHRCFLATDGREVEGREEKGGKVG